MTAAHPPAGALRPARRAKPANTPLHMTGLALLFVAAGMVVSAAVELVDGGPEIGSLMASAVVTATSGLLLWRGTRLPREVGPRSAFAAVAWTWILVSIFGGLPYVFGGVFDNLDDAVFESIAGFTGTGATVLAPIEGNSAGILFWRQMTQWFGGMGMVVLAVAVLPFLGVGGLELIKAEAPGPESDRLTPRVSETAKRLWFMYLAISVLAAVGLLAAGMTPYDAVAHSFSAVSTGGFSPYDASIAHFSSLAVELVLIVVMIAGAVNFTLHWRAAQGELGAYWRMSEFRVLAGLLGFAVAFAAIVNVADGMAAGRALRDSAFTVVSIGTTTGYGTADYVTWAAGIQLLLVFLMITGAMTGSTSGAAKLMRFELLAKYARREIQRARHPRGVFAVRFDGRSVPERIIELTIGFLILYLALFMVGVFLLTALGADFVTAIGAAAASMGCVGPGIGEVGPASNFLALSRPARVVIDVLMLFGRLEIFPMLLMFSAGSRVMARRGTARRAARSGRGAVRETPAGGEAREGTTVR